MSYCRWSSDFGECDVYVYEDVSGGWTTHVAGRRLKHRIPDEIRNMPTLNDDGTLNPEMLMAQIRAEQEWRESLPSDEFPCRTIDPETKQSKPGTMKTPKDSEYIDLSTISRFAGEIFNDPTPGECANRLEKIRASGLNIPQYAIDALREDDGGDT